MLLKQFLGLACALMGAAAPALCATAPAKLAERLVEARFDTFNRHDLDGLVALYAPNAVLTSPGFCQDRIGLAGARRAYSELFQAVPDIQDQVLVAVIDRNHIAVQFIARSTRPGSHHA